MFDGLKEKLGRFSDEVEEDVEAEAAVGGEDAAGAPDADAGDSDAGDADGGADPAAETPEADAGDRKSVV